MQIINFSLGFRVGKFRDGGFLNIIYVFFFQFLISIQILKLRLGFRVGKFRNNGILKIVYGFILPKFKLK